MIDFTIATFADALLRGALTHPDRDCIVVDNDRVTYSCLLYTSDAADDTT